MSYAAGLREKSKSCDFHDDDERILKHIIQTTDNTDLVRRVLNKKWTLKETLEEMQVLGDTSEQVEVIGRQNSNSVSKIGKHKKEKRKSLNDARQKESHKTSHANIVGKHIQCKRNFVQLIGISAANVEDQIIFLLFVCHQKRHCENGGTNFLTTGDTGETSEEQETNPRLMILKEMKTETLIS